MLSVGPLLDVLNYEQNYLFVGYGFRSANRWIAIDGRYKKARAITLLKEVRLFSHNQKETAAGHKFIHRQLAALVRTYLVTQHKKEGSDDSQCSFENHEPPRSLLAF